MGVFAHLFGRLPAAIAPLPAAISGPALVRAERLTLRYGDLRALDGIGLELRAGELTFLVGPTGAGKTSLLKVLSGVVRPTSGEVFVDGIALHAGGRRRARALRRRIGIVPQDDLLIPKRTALENVALALELADVRLPRSEARARAERQLKAAGLARRSRAYPAELSAGERRRLAVARAAVRQPKLLLADEPTGHLDPERSEDVVELLVAAAREGAAVLVATHTGELARGLHARVIEIRRGRLVADQEQRSRRLWLLQ
jgi:cell division transport system ATP-binding protein